MNFNQLKLFTTLAEELHFGAAADKCHVSASALSRNIKQLEEALGANLFERSNRHVELTEHGRQFLPFAHECLSQWQLYQESLNTDCLRGQLSLYCSVTASYSFLYETLTQFRRLHPGIAIKVHTGDPASALDRVLSQAEDLAIGTMPTVLPDEILFKPIRRTQLVLWSAKGQHWADDWSQIPVILPEEGIARERINQWFRQQQIKPLVYAEAKGNEAIVSMVSLGFGVGIAPAIVVENSPLASQVERFAIQPNLGAYDIGLFVLKKRLKRPILAAFWQALN